MIFQYINIIIYFLILASDPPHKTVKDDYPYQIKTLAKDGAWLWFNNEIVLADQNAIYIASEDSKGNAQVLLYRIKSQTDDNRYIDYNLSSWPERSRKLPSHAYPSILKLSNGNLLAVYHRSSTKMFYRTGEVIERGTENQRLNWGKEITLELKNGMNYNNLIQLSGENNRLYNFFSIFKQSPALVISEDNASTWSDDYIFMSQGGKETSPYMRYADNGKDRIDVIYTDGHPRNEFQNNIYHIYYSEGKFKRSDGSDICKLSDKSQFPPESGTKIYDGNNAGPGWVWDIEYDQSNNPVAAYISSADGADGYDLRYRYAKWNSKTKSWKEGQIAYAGSHLYIPENHFAGGITIDPENVNIVYISSNVNPETGKPTDTQKYQIYRGRTKNDGKTWKWEQLTFDTDKDNFRPVVPRNHGCKICVIWYNYVSSSDGFVSDVLGIIEE